MEERLLELERLWRESPADAGLALDLARACLRAGRAQRALTVSRPHTHEGARLRAAERIADRVGVEFVGLENGFERFDAQGEALVLVPGGALLDDGAGAWSSSLSNGGSRAPLERVVLADVLLSVVAEPAPTRADALSRARALGGRLPTACEWKKAWRGGVFFDGDETATLANPSPDRVAPWGFEDEPQGPLTSAYGLLFERDACEWCERADLGLILDTANGRYHVPLGTPTQRRARRLASRVAFDVSRV